MKKRAYKISAFLVFFTILIHAQKFKHEFSKEIPIKKGTNITLIANYADIEIKEWNKNKVQIEAIMEVDGVDEKMAQSYFDSWRIDLKEENNKVKIISKSRNRFPVLDNDAFLGLKSMHHKMPEISIKSLGVLDSMNLSFPEINFNEVFNDSSFNEIFTYDFNVELDSLTEKINSIDFEKLKQNQEYLQEWQKENKENFIKLRESALKLALRNRKYFESREKMALKRAKYAQKRAKMANKRAKYAMRKAKMQHIKKRRKKIKEILKNRKEAKVRTKLIIRVPKGTNFNMNVNYSTISTD